MLNPQRMLLASGCALALLPMLLIALVILALVASNGPEPAATAAPADPVCAPPPTPDGSVAGYRGAQLVNATLIVQAGKDRRLPARAWVVAVATAMQESALINVPHGDAAGPDSLGLFQQRASWGPAQVRLDPYQSAGLFYTRLIAIPGWATLPLTVAAQAVQRSQFPGAYAAHERAAGQVVGAVADIPCQPATTANRAGPATH